MTLAFPWGGDIPGSETSPQFLAWAMQDPLAAPLQRLQIVKTWHDGNAPQSKVFDAACSSGTPDSVSHRCADNGASVDITTCNRADGTGQTELKALWQDPEFDPGQYAAYYVRAIQNPTCRWSTWDAIRAGTEPNPLLPTTLQERAWTSPIWYNPEKKENPQ